jgi:hypothetical protein
MLPDQTGRGERSSSDKRSRFTCSHDIPRVDAIGSQPEWTPPGRESDSLLKRAHGAERYASDGGARLHTVKLACKERHEASDKFPRLVWSEEQVAEALAVEPLHKPKCTPDDSRGP